MSLKYLAKFFFPFLALFLPWILFFISNLDRNKESIPTYGPNYAKIKTTISFRIPFFLLLRKVFPDMYFFISCLKTIKNHVSHLNYIFKLSHQKSNLFFSIYRNKSLLCTDSFGFEKLCKVWTLKSFDLCSNYFFRKS